MMKQVAKFLMTFALLSSAKIYSQGEITTPEGTFHESFPAGSTDFSSTLLKAKMAGNTTINVTSSDPAAIQAIQQQADQMGMKVNVNPPNGSTTSSTPPPVQAPAQNTVTNPDQTPAPVPVTAAVPQPVNWDQDRQSTTDRISVTSPDQTPAPTPVTAAVPQPANLDQDRQSVIDRINAFRQTKGLPPLQRWIEGEACADNQAKNDAISGVMHGSFGACNESGQMTCPGWDSIGSVNSGCLQQMWDEGPGEGMEHIHYNIMTSTAYTKAAIGIFQMSNGKLWIDMNFK